MECEKLIFFGFYGKIFFIQGVIALFRYLLFYLLLAVCLGLFAYCIPSLRSVQLSSEGVGSGGSPEYDDYSEGEEEDPECEEGDDETECEEDDDIDEMDMPYDIRVDTASYLTCDSRNLPDNTFAFKLEALKDGVLGAGVRLRKKFVQMEKDEIRQYPYYRSYPALIPIPPRWWVHPSSEIQNPIPSRSLSLPSIELEDHLDTFLENGESFTNRFGRDRFQLGWEANLNLKFSPHSIFQSRYLLLSFYHSGRGSSLLGYRDLEDQQRETTHGRYYRIDMEEEEQYYILQDITERYPLGSRNFSQKENSWNCNIRLQVRRHDNHRYLGEALSEERGCEDNDDGNEVYELVRQVLGDDWNINLEERCISLRNHRKSCYTYTHTPLRASMATNQGKGRVDYSGDCTGREIIKLCPHYLSICTR